MDCKSYKAEKLRMYLFHENTLYLKRKTNFVILFLCSLLLISCDSANDIEIQKINSHEVLSDDELQQQQQEQHQPQLHTYYFGFDLRSSPQEDAAQYLPFLKYLESTTGYHFKLYFTPKNSFTGDELGQNKIQFAAMGATSFIKADSKYNVISLVRGINHQGKATYQSVFVVKPGSRIHSIKDIKGSKMAFGSRDSTQGHLIPRIMMMENNLSLKSLKTYIYTGSHQNCAEAVVSGKADVCGMQDQLAEKLATQGALKIIHHSHDFPSSGIVVNKSVPDDVVAKVKQALLDFEPEEKNRNGLYNWNSTEMSKGFTNANQMDYKQLRQWSIRLNFLQASDAPVQGLVK